MTGMFEKGDIVVRFGFFMCWHTDSLDIFFCNFLRYLHTNYSKIKFPILITAAARACYSQKCEWISIMYTLQVIRFNNVAFTLCFLLILYVEYVEYTNRVYHITYITKNNPILATLIKFNIHIYVCIYAINILLMRLVNISW